MQCTHTRHIQCIYIYNKTFAKHIIILMKREEKQTQFFASLENISVSLQAQIKHNIALFIYFNESKTLNKIKMENH